MDALWYVRRLSRMGPREIGGRVVTAARIREWRAELDAPVPPLSTPPPAFTAALPADALAAVSDEAAANLLATADRLMAGHAEYFGVQRDDMVAPDWSLDPKTGRRAPADVYAFDVPYRNEDAVGDVKQLWEPSRHQHLTVLAAAYALTGDDPYAHRVADHLKSWWAANPPMRGVHWISGIELGIRLLSWVWVRRLLDGWSGAPDLFEHNPEAVHQIHAHQRWLAAFPSRGSSANNHVIAEDAGRLAAACAFDWFAESAGWRADALASLDLQLRRNTFPSGINRELASEYHGLVLELGLAAAAEVQAAGLAVPATTWRVLLRMTDALAAVVDDKLHPPRQGDGDDGYGLVVDGTATPRWASLLATGDALFGGGTGGHRPGRRRPDAAARRLSVGRPVVPAPGRSHFAFRRRGHHHPALPRRRRRDLVPLRRQARTGSSRSRPTRTLTLCPSRSGTAASTSSPTRAPTATTANRPGGATSARRGRTTPSSSTASISPVRAGPSCGHGTRGAGCLPSCEMARGHAMAGRAPWLRPRR